MHKTILVIIASCFVIGCEFNYPRSSSKQISNNQSYYPILREAIKALIPSSENENVIKLYLNDTLGDVECGFTITDTNGKIHYSISDTDYNGLYSQVLKDSIRMLEIIDIQKLGSFEGINIEKLDSIPKDTIKEDRWNQRIQFSKLYYNNDSTQCLFYFKYSCGGLCGGGDLILMEIIKGKWKLVRRDVQIVS